MTITSISYKTSGKKIWNITGGILKADDEGFTNEDGHWEPFTIDLGNKKQVKKFLEGRMHRQKRWFW